MCLEPRIEDVQLKLNQGIFCYCGVAADQEKIQSVFWQLCLWEEIIVLRIRSLESFALGEVLCHHLWVIWIFVFEPLLCLGSLAFVAYLQL